MAGRNGQTVTLDANGVAQTETSPNGRTITTTVTATNNEVTINYAGDRMNEDSFSHYPNLSPAVDGSRPSSRSIKNVWIVSAEGGQPGRK